MQKEGMKVSTPFFCIQTHIAMTTEKSKARGIRMHHGKTYNLQCINVCAYLL